MAYLPLTTHRSTIGWKFYLCFIIPGSLGAAIMYFFFPNTKGMPLEEVAAIFGDADEVAIFQRDIDIDVDDVTGFGVEGKHGVHDVETVERSAAHPKAMS